MNSLVLPVLLVVLFFSWVIWSIKRHRDPSLRVEADAPVTDLMPSLAGLTLGNAVEGNSVEVFENGAFYDALLEDIGAATASVHFETFLWKDGVLGRRIADALCARSRAGAAVRVLVDANGARSMGPETERRLREAGCRLVKFHPLSWRERMLRCGVRLFEYPHTLLHQKVMTIDGAWCAVGSANFDDRSFETNDELVVSFIDAATARKLDDVFERYARDAHEITLESWRRRTWGHRLVDNAVYLINEVL